MASCDFSEIKGDDIWTGEVWGGEDASFNTTYLSLTQPSVFGSAVEAHKRVLAEEREREAAIAFNTLTTPIDENDVDDLQWAWTERQKKLNTEKAQKHINTLLNMILADGGKDTIIQNIRKAIHTATHKRDLKTETITYDSDDTITEDGVTYHLDWLVKKTDVLSQIANAFNQMHFVARRSSEYNAITGLTLIRIIVEFWP